MLMEEVKEKGASDWALKKDKSLRQLHKIKAKLVLLLFDQLAS